MAQVYPIDILLVEDNPGDVLLTQEAFLESNIAINLHVAYDGIEAVDFLMQQGDYADAISPDIVLLDLNLPRMDGRQVLERVKSNDQLKHIPIIVLTTSAAEEDILHSYDLHANADITKPIDLLEFMEIIKVTNQFWFHIVQLPKKS